MLVATLAHLPLRDEIGTSGALGVHLCKFKEKTHKRGDTGLERVSVAPVMRCYFRKEAD